MAEAASTYTQAELALRFRARQAMLPRCGACGRRIRPGDGACTACAARRTSIINAPPLRADVANGAARTYKPKPCHTPSCRKVFMPTGPRALFCKACR